MCAQATRLGRDRVRTPIRRSSVRRIAAVVLDRLAHRIHADHRVTAAETAGRRRPRRGCRRGRRPGGSAGPGRPGHAATAHRVPAPRDGPDLAPREGEVLVAHQLGDRRGDLRRDRPPGSPGIRPRRSRRRARTRGTRRRSGRRSGRRPAVELIEDQAADLVVVGVDQRDDRRSPRASRRPGPAWPRPARVPNRAAMPASRSPDFSSFALGEDFAEVGEGESLVADGGGQSHGVDPSRVAAIIAGRPGGDNGRGDPVTRRVFLAPSMRNEARDGGTGGKTRNRGPHPIQLCTLSRSPRFGKN